MSRRCNSWVFCLSSGVIDDLLYSHAAGMSVLASAGQRQQDNTVFGWRAVLPKIYFCISAGGVCRVQVGGLVGVM
jgi:hypothetical protein